MKKIPQHFLANIMGLPKERRYKALESYHFGSAGRWSYKALFKAAPDILATPVGHFGKLPELDDTQLAALIRQNCSSGIEAEFRSNLKIARNLRRFAKEPQSIAQKLEMPAGRFGAGEYFKFWHDIVIEYKGERFVLTIDPNVAGLTARGRKVAASLVDCFVIDGTPQLADYRCGYLYFPKIGSTSERGYKFSPIDPNDLFSYEELREMYLHTYSEYAQLIKDIRDGNLSTGSTGPLI